MREFALSDEERAKRKLNTASAPDSPVLTENRASLDWVRIVAALLALLSFVLIPISGALGWTSAREAFVVFAGYFALGTAPLQLAEGYRGAKYLILSLGIGLATVSLIGFVLLEVSAWSASEWVFAWLCVGAAAIHLVSLKRNLLDSLTEARSELGRTAARLWTRTTLRIVGPSALGLILCLAGALSSRDLIPGHGGLLFSISPLWIAGIVVLIGAVVLGWRDGASSSLAVPVVSLLVMLVATPAIVYQLPRYTWSQKHIGVTLHFLQYGVINTKIDIYQSWPAFFGGVAWLCKAGHVANLEAFARWWPAVTDTINLFSVYFIGTVIGLSKRRAWLAAIFFTLGNTVNQDYFSPQSAAFVLFLIVFALCLHPNGRKAAFRWVDWAIFVLLVSVIAVTHQLTPFATVGILLVFTVFGLTRRRLLPLVAFVPASLWALSHVNEVRKYFNVSDVGNVAVNIQDPNSNLHYHYIWYIHLGDIGEGLAPLIVGVAALIALVTWRRRVTFSLAAAAASCGFIVVAVHYGSEDIYRATLFALPWLALLAGHIRIAIKRLAAVALSVLLTVLTASYIVGDMGFDDTYVIRPTDLTADLYFEQTAPIGSTLIDIGSYSSDNPLASPRYPFYRYGIVLSDGLQNSTVKDAASVFTNYDLSLSPYSPALKHGVYAIGTQTAAVQLADDGVMTLDQYREFELNLTHSRNWTLIYHTPTAELFKFRK